MTRTKINHIVSFSHQDNNTNLNLKPPLCCPWFIIEAYELLTIELRKDLGIKHHFLEKVWVGNNVIEILIDVPTIEVVVDVLILVLYSDNMVLKLGQNLDKGT